MCGVARVAYALIITLPTYASIGCANYRGTGQGLVLRLQRWTGQGLALRLGRRPAGQHTRQSLALRLGRRPAGKQTRQSLALRLVCGRGNLASPVLLV